METKPLRKEVLLDGTISYELYPSGRLESSELCMPGQVALGHLATDTVVDVDTILFDLDGTLQFGDKGELLARLGAVSTILGSDFTSEEIEEFSNRSDYLDMKQMMIAEHNQRFPHNPITDKRFQAVNSDVTGSFDERLYLADEAVETIETIRANNIETGLVTTRGRVSTMRLLGQHGIARLFDTVVTRGDCAERKPDPRPLAIALERLGKKDPRRALFVGNLQYEDVAAGNRLGAPTALVSQRPIDPLGPTPTYHWHNLTPLRLFYGGQHQLVAIQTGSA